MKSLLLTAATAALVFTAGMAHAEDARVLSYEANTIPEKNAYTYEFDRDEQCQGYSWGIKRLGYNNPCAVDVANVEPAASREVLKEYVVYFDFDKDAVRPQDMDILKQAASEITKYNPSDVEVIGYTDTRGSMDYNSALSGRRADNVSGQLTTMGVKNYVVDQMAKGETDLAVPTGDEVMMQANRRVTVQFLR